MLKAETSPSRAPRGTKPVIQAFFTALDAIPEATRAAVAKAAQTMIRDELKGRKEKMKVAAAKEKARKPTAPAKAPKASTPKAAPKVAKTSKAAASKMPAAAKANGAEPPAAPAKRRSRKPVDVPTPV